MKKRYGRVADYASWRRPRLVDNALELLAREIPRFKRKMDSVFMSLATDCFMYRMPEVEELTLAIIKRLNEAEIPVTTLTKGVYPAVLAENGFHQDNRYGSSIVSSSEDFRRRFEPGAAPYRERIAALRLLHDAGLKTYVHMEPYPTPNIIEQDVEEILEEVSFVDDISFSRWNYSRLPNEFPEAAAFYAAESAKVQTFFAARSIRR